MKNDKILIGTDPELFVAKDGKIDSIAGVLGLSKEDKHHEHGFRLQEDNVLVEFDTDPVEDFRNFSHLIKKAISFTDEFIGVHGFETVAGVSSHLFRRAEIESFHKNALVFGCDPDYNALNDQRFEKQRVSPGLRTAGGHVHLGWNHLKGDIDHDDKRKVALMCDYFLGLPSLLLDNDVRRRQLYGAAGAYRPKVYGIEYRSLSNFWIHDEANKKLVWDQSKKAYEAGLTDMYDHLTAAIDAREIQRVINEGDTAMAEQYLKLLEIV